MLLADVAVSFDSVNGTIANFLANVQSWFTYGSNWVVTLMIMLTGLILGIGLIGAAIRFWLA